MFYSDDPIKDHILHDAKQQKELEKLPKCAECGEPVRDDHYYLINDEVICPDCLEANYRKDVRDWFE